MCVHHSPSITHATGAYTRLEIMSDEVYTDYKGERCATIKKGAKANDKLYPAALFFCKSFTRIYIHPGVCRIYIYIYIYSCDTKFPTRESHLMKWELTLCAHAHFHTGLIQRLVTLYKGRAMVAHARVVNSSRYSIYV